MRLRQWLVTLDNAAVIAMATVSLSTQQYQQMVDRITGLESMMTNLQSHAESQQEQIRVAELVIQQLRTAGTPTNPPLAYPWYFSETGD